MAVFIRILIVLPGSCKQAEYKSDVSAAGGVNRVDRHIPLAAYWILHVMSWREVGLPSLGGATRVSQIMATFIRTRTPLHEEDCNKQNSAREALNINERL